MLSPSKYTLYRATPSYVSSVVLWKVKCFLALTFRIHIHIGLLMSSKLRFIYVVPILFSVVCIIFGFCFFTLYQKLVIWPNLSHHYDVLMSLHEDGISHLPWCNTIATSWPWGFVSFRLDISCMEHGVTYL